MMNPACKHALGSRSANQGKIFRTHYGYNYGSSRRRREVLREALALAADRAILICDKLWPERILRHFIGLTASNKKRNCPKIYLIHLCSRQHTDSETARVVLAV